MTRLLLRLYRIVLRLYPAQVRRRTGRDMEECFQDLMEGARQKGGRGAVLWVAARTFAEAPLSAWRARRRMARTTGTTTGGGMETLWQDIRYAVRGLARSPGFTALAVLSLGLGVGANTTMFSMVNSVVWRDLPGVEDPDRVVRIFQIHESAREVSYPNFVDIVREADVLDGAFLHDLETVSLASDEISQVIHGEIVTTEYFDVLGVTPALGRFLSPEADGAPTSPLVVVLSHHLWVEAFGADPSVVGRIVQLNGHDAAIVGVAPDGFEGTKFGLSLDFWLPIRAWGFAEGWGERWEESRGNTSAYMVARLAPDTDLEGANAALATLGRRLADAYPEVNRDMTLRAYPEVAGSVNPDAAGLPDFIGLVALLASVLVLLVACGNVASLLLARAVARRQEIGVRVALGAGRGRLIRQLLTESGLLALLAGGVGLILAETAARLQGHLLPVIPYRFALDVSPDGETVLFALGASLGAVLVFGLVPALQASRPGIAGVLRGDESGGRLGFSGAGLLNTVVVGMVALSFVTLFLSGLFFSSLERVQDIQPGWATENRLLGTVNVALGGYESQAAPAFYRRLQEEAAALPGVRGAAVASAIPMGDWSASSRIYADDRDYAPDEAGPDTWLASVTPEFFDVAGTRLLSGRGFTDADDAKAPGVVVVNEALAHLFWPDESPLGKRVRFTREAGDATWEVVGVAETARYMSITEGPSPALYFSYRQRPRTRAVVTVHTAGPPASVAGALREVVRGLDPSVPLFDVKTIDAHMSNTYWLYRLGAELGVAIGLLAAALAAAGLYGIMGFRVGRRRREMGIRMALGAGKGRVLGHVLKSSLTLVGVGIAIGGGAAAAASGVVESLLYGVEPLSPAHLAGVALALAALSTLATLAPARAATRADPVQAIKVE